MFTYLSRKVEVKSDFENHITCGSIWSISIDIYFYYIYEMKQTEK